MIDNASCVHRATAVWLFSFCFSNMWAFVRFYKFVKFLWLQVSPLKQKFLFSRSQGSISSNLAGTLFGSIQWRTVLRGTSLE